MHPKRFKLGRDDRAYGRDDNAPEALKQVGVSTISTGYIAKPANLRGARKGDRVEPAGSHIGNDSDYPRIVGFRDVDIGKYRIWNGAGGFDEIH